MPIETLSREAGDDTDLINDPAPIPGTTRELRSVRHRRTVPALFGETPVRQATSAGDRDRQPVLPPLSPSPRIGSRR